MAGYNVATLAKLIEQFERMPGIGHKTAQRLAFYVLNLTKQQAEEFSATILSAHEKIKQCSCCCNLAEDELCPICKNEGRDKSVICVVEDPRDVFAFERTHEYEGTYKFTTLGAKKYCSVKDGKLSITISGVGKSIGSKELEERGGIDSFKEGFTFYKAGGTESVYNDKVKERIEIDGHELIITDNVYIRDSSYTLGTTEEYKRILQRPKLWLDRFK